MSDVTKTISDWLHEKINSPLYIVFILVEISLHWKYLYALFIEDRVPSNLSSFEYAQQFLQKFDFTLSDKFHFLERLFEFLANLGYSVVIPIIITYIILYYLPMLHGIVHRDTLKFHFEREGEFNKQKKDFEKAQIDNLDEVKALVVKQNEITKDILKEKEEQKEILTESLSKEDLWEKEFQHLRRTNMREYLKLTNVKNVLISGHAYENDRTELVYALLTELISVDGNRAFLTEKGKYFVKRYMDEGGK